MIQAEVSTYVGSADSSLDHAVPVYLCGLPVPTRLADIL